MTEEYISVNDIKNWRIEDPFPEKDLDEIFPSSKRAVSLMSRHADKEILKQGFINIMGAVVMLKGMDYHYDNFMKCIEDLKNGGDIESQSSLDHEIVAYINRVGQFYYFCDSEFVRGALGNCIKAIPRITDLSNFRMKHTAHRSLDKAKPEDTPHQRLNQAMSLSSLGGRVFEPRFPSNEPILRKNLWKTHYLSYQINVNDPPFHLFFVPEKDHLSVMHEAYSVLEKLLR